jgi:hypothetical protein
VDWQPVDRLLEPIHAASTGRPGYPPLTMVKVLLLQSWYGLGDPAMEEALGDRLSFRRFVGLALGEAVRTIRRSAVSAPRSRAAPWPRRCLPRSTGS